MKTSRLVMISICAAALGASAAFADSGPATPRTLEVSTSLAFNRSSYSLENSDVSFSVTHLNASAGLGRSMTENFQLNGALLFQHRSLLGGGQNGIGAALGTTYNFTPQGNVIPFASASLGAVSYFEDGVSDKAFLLPMLRAGFRSMIGGDKSLNVSMGYQHESNSESSTPGSSNMFDVGVGVSLFQSR
jgi:hypothetical protein